MANFPYVSTSQLSKLHTLSISCVHMKQWTTNKPAAVVWTQPLWIVYILVYCAKLRNWGNWMKHLIMVSRLCVYNLKNKINKRPRFQKKTQQKPSSVLTGVQVEATPLKFVFLILIYVIVVQFSFGQWSLTELSSLSWWRNQAKVQFNEHNGACVTNGEAIPHKLARASDSACNLFHLWRCVKTFFFFNIVRSDLGNILFKPDQQPDFSN